MGKEKYLKQILELFNKSVIVNYDSIERFVKNKKKSNQYTKQLVNNLVKKNKIKKLAKGFYTLNDDNSLIVYCFKPAYLGLQDALSFHGLWEQETIPVVITTRRVRTGIRKVMNGNVLIRRVDKKYLFGYDYYKYNNVYLPYSDIEKTLIDMVYFKEKIDDGAIEDFKKKINKKKLKLYLRKYPKKIKELVIKIYNKTNKTL